MSLRVWLPLNKDPNVIVPIASFYKEGGITLTEDTNGWYKVADSTHTSGTWGIYYNFPVESNTNYTLRVYSKSGGSAPASIRIQSYTHNSTWPSQRDSNATTTEKLTTYNWTTGADDTVARIYLAMSCTSTSANNYVFYKAPEVLKEPVNQGLDKISMINNGGAFNSSGKLGGCYNFLGTGTAMTNEITSSQNLSISGDASYSIAFWFYWDGDTWSNDYVGVAGFGSQSTAAGAWGCLYNGRPDLDFWNCRYIASNQLSVKTWYHIAFTKQSSTGMEGHIYVNGIEVSGNSVGSYTPNISSYKVIIGRLSPGMTSRAFKGKINDVRIYDHCLSPMEVKELAKGLVLHYPLSDEYVESTTNLVTTEDGLSNTCYNGATSKYGYGTNTDMYKTLGIFEGRKSTKVYMGTAGLKAYPYIYFDNFNASGTAIQTLSFDYYPTTQDTLIPYSYNGMYNFSYTTDKTSGLANRTGQITIPVEVGRWNHITVTAQKTDTTDTNRGLGYVRIGSASHTSATSNYWLFGNVQVEAKDHATGYAGVGGARNSNTVYDISGFCNNGTISGALTISNDAPKYQVSTYMSKAALITHPRPVFGGTDQEWTCAMWVKLDTVNQSGLAMNNFNIANNIVHAANGTPLLYLNAGTDDYYMYGSQAVSANIWTHIVFVFKNEGDIRNIYINGILKNNYGPNKTSTPQGISDIVTIGYNLAGYISDYRIYATALSANDVKSLYLDGHHSA